MKSFHSSQLVSVCTCVVIELGVYPQKLACTPKFEKQGVHVPPVSKWSGHAAVIFQSGQTGFGPLAHGQVSSSNEIASYLLFLNIHELLTFDR